MEILAGKNAMKATTKIEAQGKIYYFAGFITTFAVVFKLTVLCSNYCVL